MQNSTDAKAPEHLTTEAQEWWRQLATEYAIRDGGGLLLLQTALEAFDRMREAQAAIQRDGAVVKDRFNQLKPHALLTTERDARAQMLSALRSLNMDVSGVR